MPHNSKIATIANTITMIFRPLSVQSTNAVVSFASKFLIKKENRGKGDNQNNDIFVKKKKRA